MGCVDDIAIVQVTKTIKKIEKTNITVRKVESWVDKALVTSRTQNSARLEK